MKLGGEMDSVLIPSAVVHGLEPCSGHENQRLCYLGIYCFSAKHAELRSKCKDWLVQNQNNVSE